LQMSDSADHNCGDTELSEHHLYDAPLTVMPLW